MKTKQSKKERENILYSLKILDAYGISMKQNDLIYGEFEKGYIVVYHNYDLDVFLTSRLPKDQSDNDSKFVLLKCLSYRYNNEEKSKMLKKIIETAGKRIL